MKRYIHDQVVQDLKRDKMVILTGPRQVGKTYLTRELMKEFSNAAYFNYDAPEFAGAIEKRQFHPESELIVLDEIHKMKNWKQYLKGLYDTRNKGQKILVTGSARMETFRQGGESLAGRYYHHRLMPLSLKELESAKESVDLTRLMNLGGFPQPYLSNSATEAKRWRLQYYTDLIREDILEMSRIHEIRTMKLLLEMLQSRVGSPISFNALAEDLHLSPATVEKYIHILESLYIVFLVYPFHKNIARAVSRPPKLYFLDTGLVLGNEGIKLENLCAVSLLKHVYFQQDHAGERMNLFYLRDKEGNEVDFLLSVDDQPAQMIEIKSSDKKIGKSLKHFKNILPQIKCSQWELYGGSSTYEDGIEKIPLKEALLKLSC